MSPGLAFPNLVYFPLLKETAVATKPRAQLKGPMAPTREEKRESSWAKYDPEIQWKVCCISPALVVLLLRCYSDMRVEVVQWLSLMVWDHSLFFQGDIGQELHE